MKRLTKCICFLLIVALLPISVFADSGVRASNFFAINSTYIEKVSGTTFEVWFDVTAVEPMDQLGTSTITIQRSSNGSTWTSVKTYSKANYSQMIEEDTFWYANCVTYTGTSGYYYRAKVTFYAKNGSDSGTYTMYTSKVTVP